MAKITRIQDLPAWFSLEKYKGIESFGAFEWLKQLERRQDLLRHYPTDAAFQEYPETLQAIALELWRGGVQEGAAQIWDNPIELSESSLGGMPNKWVSDVPGLPVRFVCVSALAEQMQRDRWAAIECRVERSLYNRWAAINNEAIKPLPGIAKVSSPFAATSAMRGVIPSGHMDPLSIDYYQGAPASPVIQVDLSAPDSVLRAAFAEWLRTARAGQQDDAKPRKPLYERWVKYGVLPYLDLLIWSLVMAIHIPDEVMAEAITPDQGRLASDGKSRSADDLRKTTKKCAKDLMRDLSELKSLTAVEAADRAT